MVSLAGHAARRKLAVGYVASNAFRCHSRAGLGTRLPKKVHVGIWYKVYRVEGLGCRVGIWYFLGPRRDSNITA